VLSATRDGDDVRAAPGKGQRDRPSDPAAGAGDQGAPHFKVKYWEGERAGAAFG
jgi:hypothetical protein